MSLETVRLRNGSEGAKELVATTHEEPNKSLGKTFAGRARRVVHI
jgi:hypothetical protein